VRAIPPAALNTLWHKFSLSVGWSVGRLVGWLVGGAVFEAAQPLARNLFATVLNNELTPPENNSWSTSLTKSREKEIEKMCTPGTAISAFRICSCGDACCFIDISVRGELAANATHANGQT